MLVRLWVIAQRVTPVVGVCGLLWVYPVGFALRWLWRCFVTETESSGLRPGVNDGPLRWTRRLMQEKSDNQSLDQPRAGESLLCTWIDAVCSSRPEQQTPSDGLQRFLLFRAAVGDMEDTFYHSVMQQYVTKLIFFNTEKTEVSRQIHLVL